MTKDLQWLKKEVNKTKKLISDAWDASIIAGNEHFEEINSSEMQVVKHISDLIDQLDEPEANSQIDKLAKFIMSEVEGEPSQSQGAVDTAIRIIKSYQNQETLSSDWIDENGRFGRFQSGGGIEFDYFVKARDLQNLLDEPEVLTDEQIARKVDQAYKDGYEKGKEHATREEEQTYYAKIKGWELFVEFIGAQYWGEVSKYGRLGFVSIDDAKDRTKDEWERLGINEDNADFVKVEEVEDEI